MNVATAGTTPEHLPGCWAWQPSKERWFDHIRAQASRFRVASALAIDQSVLRHVLHHAADDRSEWLYHPAIRALNQCDSAEPSIEAQLLLVAWCAAHDANLGGVTAPEPMRLWTPNGVIALDAGRHDLSALGSAMGASEFGGGIYLDLFGATLASGDEHAWQLAAADDRASDGLALAIREFLLATRFLAERLPAIAGWVGNVAKLIVPYAPRPTGPLRSGSDCDVPGLIRMAMGSGVVSVLEALVHESAHLYFYLVEEEALIVAVEHAELRFASPLKAQPRPLRSVLMAYHALAYIVALYAALDDERVAADRAAFLNELAELRAAADAAEATCLGARHLLTEHGRTFFDQLYGSVRDGRD